MYVIELEKNTIVIAEIFIKILKISDESFKMKMVSYQNYRNLSQNIKYESLYLYTYFNLQTYFV